MNAGRLFSRHYVLVDYPLEKTKIIVSDFDQHEQAEEAGPDRADPIRATGHGLRKRQMLECVRSTHVCHLIGGLGAYCCTRSRTPSTLVT